MTVIRPNSVSGITSITAQANEINVFRSNGLLAGLNLNGVNFNTTAGISTFAALKVTGNLDVAGVLTYQDVTNVDSLGIGTFRTGINVSGGQLDVGSNIKLGNAGVITATTFVGNFTGTSSGNAVLTGSTNNELVTVTGANAITGESGLTWTGSVFQLTSSGGNQFPFNVRNDFTPNSQRCDYGYFANSTSNNALRLGSINSNGGVTIQSTRMSDSAQKHNLILNPDGGYVWINKTSTSDYGNFEVKGPTSDNIETSDITAKTVATFSGSTPGTTAAGKGVGIVIKPISNRGCNYFFGVAGDSANQESHGRFIIRSGNFAGTTSERLRINSSGHITPGTDNSQNIGDGSTNFNSIWASTRFRGNDDVKLVLGNSQDLVVRHSGGINYIESPQGGSLQIKSGTLDNANLKHIQCDYNGNTIIYHQNGGSASERFKTTNDGIEFGGEVNFTSGYNVRTFAGTVTLGDGGHADIVQNNSGYGWGWFEFYCVSYHGSIGRARWVGNMSRYSNNDNYPTINNSMGYTNLQRIATGSPSGQVNMLRIQRTGTYGNVGYNYYVRCYAPNSSVNWSSAGYATKKYDGN